MIRCCCLEPGQSVVILGTSMIPELWSNHAEFTNTSFWLGKQLLIAIGVC